MKLLNHHNDAKPIIEKLESKIPVFVEILSGKKAGSIARVKSVTRVHFKRHLYKLEIDGMREFTETGSNLTVSKKQNTEYQNRKADEIVYKDIFDTEISIGETLIHWKNNEMCFSKVVDFDIVGLDVVGIYPLKDVTTSIRRSEKTVVINDSIEGNLLAKVLKNAS